MIRFFVYSLLALITGAVLSVVLGDDPGYVLIAFAGYSVETSVVVVVFACLALFIFLYGLTALLRHCVRLLRKGGVRIFSNRRRARSATEKGLLLLSEGKARDAYRLLVQSARNVESPLLNWMAASLAAFQENDRKSWVYCLQQAEKIAGSAEPIDSLKAFYEMKSGNIEQSLAMLLELRKQQPNNAYFLRMLKNIYRTLEDWEQVLLLMPDLEKYHVISEEEIFSLTVEASEARIRQLGLERDHKELHIFWEGLGRRYQQNERLMQAYVEALVDGGNVEQVQKQVSKYLKHSWSERLVLALGYLDADNPGELILWLEKWIKDRPGNAALALTLGRLCLRNQEWVKAREYFEKALQFAKVDELSAEVSAELGRLLDHLGEHERSVACYRNAIGMGGKKLPDLPMPL